MSDQDAGSTEQPSAHGEDSIPPAPPVPQAPPAQMVTPPAPNAGVKRGGTVVGIILVCVGLVMLFGGYIPWFDLFRLWPLIIVIGGLAEMVRTSGEPWLKRVAEGAGSIAVGLVLLGNTFGYIPWTVWLTMLSLWPLLLVALGIELLGRGLRVTWVRALSNVVLLMGLLYGVFVLQPGSVGPLPVVSGVGTAGVAYSDSASAGTAVGFGTATVKAGATQLKIGPGADLARIAGIAPAGAAPTLRTTVASDSAAVIIEDPTSHTVVLGTKTNTLDVTLGRAVTWKDIELDLGAVQADADLSQLKVDSVSVNAGASDVKITLPKTRDVLVDISGGVANVTLRVPGGASVSLDAQSGLTNVTVPLGYRHISGMPFLGASRWESTGSGGPRIGVTLRTGISNLTVESY